MHRFTTFSTVAVTAAVALASPAASSGKPEHNPANTISLEADHADSFRHFAPELPKMQARAATINTDWPVVLTKPSANSSA